MYIYVYQDIYRASDSYHGGGGAVVIAESREAADRLIESTAVCDPWNPEEHKHEPECFAVVADSQEPGEYADPEEYELVGHRGEKVWFFPNAGCC